MNGWLHDAAGAATGLAATPVTQFWSNMSDRWPAPAARCAKPRRREPDMANDASRQARTALVTGGTGCLGRAIAIALHDAGHRSW